jgi:hypothetical protein
VQEARNLRGRLFTAFRRARNERRLGHIGCHRQTHAAQKLNSFGDRIDQFALSS